MIKDTKTSVAEQNTDTKPADNKNVENNTADTGNVNPDNIPYARFNEVTKQNKKLAEKLKAIESAQEESRLAKLEEDGQFKEIISEQKATLKSYEEKIAYYNNLEQEERDGLLSQLSKDDQEIYGDLSTSKLRTHIGNISKANSVRTDKSAPVRGNNLGIKNDADIWKMDKQDRQKNWSDIVSHFTRKK